MGERNQFVISKSACISKWVSYFPSNQITLKHPLHKLEIKAWWPWPQMQTIHWFHIVSDFIGRLPQTYATNHGAVMAENSNDLCDLDIWRIDLEMVCDPLFTHVPHTVLSLI